MSHRDSKKLEVFKLFCRLTGIEASKAQEQRLPHPDILASVGGVMVVYELTEAVEPEYERKFSDMFKTPSVVRHQDKSISRNLRERIDATHSGKAIDICFRPDLSLRERAKVLIEVFRYIAELPADYGNNKLLTRPTNISVKRHT